MVKKRVVYDVLVRRKDENVSSILCVNSLQSARNAKNDLLKKYPERNYYIVILRRYIKKT